MTNEVRHPFDPRFVRMSSLRAKLHADWTATPKLWMLLLLGTAAASLAICVAALMGHAQWFEYGYWIAGLPCVLCGFVTTYFSLKLRRRVRAEQMLVCPACLYSLRGLEAEPGDGMNCPECGRHWTSSFLDGFWTKVII